MSNYFLLVSTSIRLYWILSLNIKNNEEHGSCRLHFSAEDLEITDLKFKHDTKVFLGSG